VGTKPSTASECTYTVREDVAPDAITRSLAALLPARLHPIGRHQYTLLDTVDGGVRRAGARLTRAGINGHSTMVWQRPGAAGHLTTTVSDRVCFAWDLPEGPLRQVLADAVGPRRLLEQAVAEEQGSLLEVLGGQGKIVARVRIVSGRARLPDAPGRWQPLPTVITLTGLRGYEGNFAQLVAVIESRPHVERCPGLESVMLHQIGAASWPVVSPNVDLPATIGAEVGARRIHRALVSTLVANEPGVRDRVDTEFLHDFRVAVRRTRSLLGQIRGVFPPAVIEHFATEFSWLGRLTGPPRDMDVLVLSIRAEYPDPAAADAQALLAFLGDLQQQEHRTLVDALDGDRYARLLSDWRTFLDSPGAPHAEAPNAGRLLAEVVSRRAWRLSRRIMASADTIDEATDAARLHEVRIHAKKLRYLIDVTPGFYDPAALERVLGSLKHLQRVIGDFNDAHVQAGRLLAFLEALSAGGSPAIGRELARLAEERHRRGASLRAQVLAAVARFGAGGTRSSCRRAFYRASAEERAQ
jgi:CHAD domain-containing protein